MPDATPIFTTRDPATGAVLFDFDGHIKAQGIDFDGEAATVGDVRSVRWLDQTQNNDVGPIITGFINAGHSRTLALKAGKIGGTPIDALNAGTGFKLSASNEPRSVGNPPLSEIDMSVQNADGSSTQTRVLLDGDGTSHFLQMVNSRRWLLQGPFSVAFNVANGADADLNVIVPTIAGTANVHVFDWVDSTAGFQFPQALTRAYEFTSNTNLRIHTSNRLGTGLAAIGTIRLLVLYMY